MIRVIIIGSGNVGIHLAHVFLSTREIKLVQVYNRSLEHLKKIEDKVPTTTNLNQLKDADLYIISLTDNSIESISKSLNFTNKLVVHTSGSTNLNALNSSNRKGVFYPLQTFSKNKELAFKNIPICIESENNNDLILLKSLASLISNNVYILDSEQRFNMHISAVFVNNFVNHMYHIGNEICEKNNIPFEILHPLIKETAEKVQTLAPKDAQTGPARRKDTPTIESQLKQLTDHHSAIYKSLTDSIIKTYS
jgi:predicted short-subunit dehydrogenase-like oxidoreductase (DUF2520 family)